MNRYKITLEYIGAGYCGWQRQQNFLSLQQIVEEAIFALTKQQVEVTASGRTDAGVNAYGQVVHFDLEQKFEPRRLMHSINHFCRGHTIGVIDCEEVSKDFHARFSAKKRHYIYKILNRNSVNIIEKDFVSWINYPLDEQKMQQGANYMLGLHDFTSFRARECQANSPMKTLDEIKITREGDHIFVKVSALSFLHHMVRNIVGTLIMVGSGKWEPDYVKEILEAKDRKKAGPTAESQGLYFLKTDY